MTVSNSARVCFPRCTRSTYGNTKSYLAKTQEIRKGVTNLSFELLPGVLVRGDGDELVTAAVHLWDLEVLREGRRGEA